MFEVKDYDNTNMRLRQAILLYGSSHGYSGSIQYATIHPVECDDEGKSAPVIRAGRPVGKDALKMVVDSLIESSRVRSGVLPDNILSIGAEFVVWWQRPGKQNYFFDCRRGPVEKDDFVSVGKRAGSAYAPGLVFVASKNRMMVFAVKGSERPGESTQLYHAPLMNIYADGSVCTGSMPLPDSTMATSVVKWQEAFWASNFTHANHAKPVNYKGGIHAFSIDLLGDKFRKFPERVLRPIKGLTLGVLVDQLDGIKGGVE